MSWLGLTDYLLSLEERFRGRRPKNIIEGLEENNIEHTLEELEKDARQNRFNSNHVMLFLFGALRLASGGAVVSLRHALFMYDAVAFGERVQQERRPREVHYERRVTSVMNLIRRLSFAAEEDRRTILELLEKQKRQFRIRDLGGPAMYRKLGISRDPTKTPLAGQSFWTPIIQQLVKYLKRTTQRPEEEVFKMTAEILHHASGGRYPVDAARVKQRWYRGGDFTTA